MLGPAGCWMVVCGWLLLAPGASAQVIQLRAGSSSLLGAHGGSIELHAGNYRSRMDVGFDHGPVFGFSLNTFRRGVNWNLGDQAIPFVLPTDLFNRSHYFLGRGMSAERKNAGGRLLVYAGTTSTGTFAPFLSTARSERGLGLVFYERQLSRTLRFTSYNAFSSRQTSIQALEWKPREDLKIATSGGIGSNQRYWSGSIELERDWISLQGSYALVGNAFRRVRVDSRRESETDRENFQLQLRPRRNVSVSLNRRNLLSPEMNGQKAMRATVNGLGIYASGGGFRLSGSAFRSRTAVGNSTAIALGLQRRMGQRLDAGINYMQSYSRGGAVKTISASFKETLTRRLSLSQVITRSQGRTTVSVGGSFQSNRFSLSLEHQTFYTPFFDGNHSPFRQVLLVSFRLRLGRDVELQAATYVSPAGRVQYTSHVTSFLYPHWNDQRKETSNARLSKYVVRGSVFDEQGQPVSGAALQIDSQMVFTNTQGLFLFHVKKPQEYALAVLTDQFMFPGRYVVVSAPDAVKGEREETAEMRKIVLRNCAVAAPLGTQTSGSSERK